jgi:uncharacterized protein
MNSCVRVESNRRQVDLVWGYFAWTLALSIPFYFWGLLWPVHSLPYGLPISAAMILLPALVATWRRHREQGATGVRALWWRLADFSRARQLRWWGVALFTMPAATVLAFLVMRQVGMPLPAKIAVAWEQLPLMFVVYMLGAIPEEIGWTGYATEPLQRRFGILGAGVIIGCVWASWHLVPWWQVHTFGWVAGQFACTVLMRVAMGWLYARGGTSLGLAVLFHAMINVTYSLFPNAGSHYNPSVVAIALTLMSFVVLPGLLVRRRR